jgi:hypothetical protein
MPAGALSAGDGSGNGDSGGPLSRAGTPSPTSTEALRSLVRQVRAGA